MCFINMGENKFCPQIRTAHELHFVFSAFLRACFPENCLASFHFSSLSAAVCKGCGASSHSAEEMKCFQMGLAKYHATKWLPSTHAT